MLCLLIVINSVVVASRSWGGEEGVRREGGGGRSEEGEGRGRERDLQVTSLCQQKVHLTIKVFSSTENSAVGEVEPEVVCQVTFSTLPSTDDNTRVYIY